MSDRPPRPGRGEDFDFLYAVTPPWDIGRPQPAFVALAGAEAIRGRVLDVGCGTGEHALMAAGRRLDATGVDMASAAIEAAKRKARDRGLSVRFLVWDAFELAGLDEQFDTVLDSGLFHIFADEDRPSYVDSLRGVIPVGGRYLVLAFSDLQPGDWGRAASPRTRSAAASPTDGGWTPSRRRGSTSPSIPPAGSTCRRRAASRPSTSEPEERPCLAGLHHPDVTASSRNASRHASPLVEEGGHGAAAAAMR